MSLGMTYQAGHLVLPGSLLFHYKDLFERAEDFLVWQFCYLQNTTKLDELLPSQMAQALGTTVAEVNRSLGRLTEGELLVIKTIEVAGEIETIFDTSPAFDKLEAILAPKPASPNPSGLVTNLDGQALRDLVADFERELGRLLSPFELEDLQKLLTEQHTDPDLVREALKEAVFNGKTNWKYIQAILNNWRKEGIVNLRQVAERRREREGLDTKHLVADEDFRQALSLWAD